MVIRRWMGWMAVWALLLTGATGASAQVAEACMVDVVLAIDHAASLAPETLAEMSAFAGRLAGALPMGTARIGVVGFAGEGVVRLGLSADGGAVAGAVAGLGIAPTAADFRTGLSAAYALLDAEARPNATRAVLLVTDGFSSTDTAARVGAVRPSQPTGVIAVGVGSGVSRRELLSLSIPAFYSYYDSSSPYTLYTTRAAELPGVAGSAAAALCRLVPTIGGSVSGRLPRDSRGVRQVLPVQNAVVTLLNGANEAIASTRTDQNGRYLFYVTPGYGYTIRVEPVPGYPFANGQDGILEGRFAGLATRSSGFSNATTLDAPGP